MNNQEVLQTGTLLYNGKYQIESVIEQGGLGITYKAKLVQLDINVTVKELFLVGKCIREEDNSISLKSFSEKRFKAFKDNFTAEGRALAKFKHPNLIQVRDIIEENNTVYLILDYIEKRNLSDYVAERGRLSEDEALSYIIQIGDALKEVHNKGFLHKDIQPSNILITEEGKAILVGLGVSGQFVSAQTKASSSPSYAPMEQYIAQYTKKDKSGYYTDVYSLAATLYYCLLGIHPISPVERQNTELTPPKFALGSISSATNDAIMKGMAMASEDRYQDMTSFLENIKPKDYNVLERSHALNKNTRLLGGKYRIDNVIGEGGLGISYKATLLQLDLPIVIKELFLTGYCTREEDNTVALQGMKEKEFRIFKKQYLNEGRILAQTQHEHIVQVKDAFSENNTVYLVMEYVEGDSLSRYVREKGKLAEIDALRYIRQVADALQVVHQKNFLHKDVRPSNIIINPQRGAVLVGLGIEKDKVKNNTDSSEAGYAPMEQYASEVKLSVPTEVYSLAATLYFTLVGEPPISAFDRYYTELESPKKYNQSVSKRTSDAILKAMSMKTEERYQEVQAFALELEEIDPAVLKRKRLIKWMSAAAITLILGSTAFVLTREDPPPKIAANEYGQYMLAAENLTEKGHFKKAALYYKGLLLVNSSDEKAIAGKKYAEKGLYINAKWWRSLSDEWKTIFRKAAHFTEEPQLQDFNNIFKLKELYCYDTQISHLKPIQHLVNLEILGIYNSPIESLNPISELTNLKELDCSSTLIKTLEPIKNLVNLTALDCSKTNVTSLEAVRNMKNLKELYFSNTAVNTLDPIRELSELTKLRFAKTAVSNIEPLKNLSNLSALYFYNTQVKNIDVLQNLGNLSVLHLYKTPINSLNAISELKNLKELHCYNTQIQDLDAIGNLVNLEELYAYSTAITNLDAIKNLQNLSYLKCYNTRINNLDALSNLKNLKVLHCNKTAIMDLKPLENLKNLHELDCSTTQISSLDALRNSKNLTNLVCYSTPIHSLDAISKLINLKELNCSNIQITDLKSLSRLRNLQKLDCSSTQISSLEPIQDLEKLTELNIASTQINTLADLANFKRLKTLNLSSTPIHSIKELQVLDKLKFVKAQNTNVAEQELNDFKQTHKETRVEI